MKKVLIPLADGFEEIEAVASIDILRRAGLDVTTVTLDDFEVHGDHGIDVLADMVIDEVDLEQFAAVVLPGGMPGADNLRKDSRVLNAIRTIYENGGLVAAVCAAPIVLEEAGVLEGKKATSYPGYDNQMPSCDYREEDVVVDGRVITGRGPGVTCDFAYTVAEFLLSAEKISELKQAMLFK
ncbi:MAG: DJ-1 family glyoxalase III [Bacillota bacterium]